MSETKADVSVVATVTLKVELRLSSPWSGDESINVLVPIAKRDALAALAGIVKRGGAETKARVVGEPKVSLSFVENE